MSYSPADPESQALFRGRACTARTAGIAGTAGHRIMSLWNGSASRTVHLNQVTIDLYQTAVKAATVIPPIIRVYRVTSAPGGGTTLTKASKDSALTTDANIVLKGATASDGGAATAISGAVASTGILTQEYAPRLITAVGYEPFDRTELLEAKDIILPPNYGVILMLDYSATAANPTSDMWIASMDWWEG